jgi:hypothetical protein
VIDALGRTQGAALAAPEVGVLEAEDRVVVADRGLEQALEVGRVRRKDDLQPGMFMNIG